MILSILFTFYLFEYTASCIVNTVCFFSVVMCVNVLAQTFSGLFNIS